MSLESCVQACVGKGGTRNFSKSQRDTFPVFFEHGERIDTTVSGKLREVKTKVKLGKGPGAWIELTGCNRVGLKKDYSECWSLVRIYLSECWHEGVLRKIELKMGIWGS